MFASARPSPAGHVILDFDGFDAWCAEDEQVFAHARDPVHGMDILPSSRRVRIELDGELLAETSRSRLLFDNTLLPPRAYIRARTCGCRCARATSSPVRYEAPLRAAADVTGLVAFFNERVDLILDGEPLQRPVTPWS